MDVQLILVVGTPRSGTTNAATSIAGLLDSNANIELPSDPLLRSRLAIKGSREPSIEDLTEGLMRRVENAASTGQRFLVERDVHPEYTSQDVETSPLSCIRKGGLGWRWLGM